MVHINMYAYNSVDPDQLAQPETSRYKRYF